MAKATKPKPTKPKPLNEGGTTPPNGPVNPPGH